LTIRKANFDNVFLEKVGERGNKKFRLLAIDQGCCFSGGRDLSPRINSIEQIMDSGIYGMFPAFVSRVRQADVDDALARLDNLREDVVARIIQSVPQEWEVAIKIRRAWQDLIYRRAMFVVKNFLPLIARICWPEQLFDK
jgi:hypothetical protein